MISIAMATYNGQYYVKDQIDSILRQTISDFELIISDDNSTDDTVSIIKSFTDKRIRFFSNTINVGFVKNFEKALSYCSGEYIAFSDQDDIWEENHLEILLNQIQGKALSCSNAELIDEFGTKKNVKMSDVLHLKKIPTSNNMLFTLMNKNFVQGSTILFRSALLKKMLPIPSEIKYHDHWLALFAANNGGVSYTWKSTLLYRQHSAAITRDKAYTIKDKIKYHRLNKEKIKNTYYYYYCQSVLFLEREKNNMSAENLSLLEKQCLYLKYRGTKEKDLRFHAVLFYFRYYTKLYYDKNFIYFFLRFFSIFF